MEEQPLPRKLQQAVDFVRGGIDTGEFVAGQYLPGVPRLCRMAGVSPVTMYKAEAILKHRGVLSGGRGEATMVSQKQSDSPDSPGLVKEPSQPLTLEEAHRRIYRQMRKDILNGVYPPDTMLPLVKQLKARYRAAGITIRKALALLCSDGLVVHRRRHYAVARLSAGDSGVTIGVLIQQVSIDVFDLGANEGHNYLREVDLQASKMPVRLVVAPFDWHADQWSIDDSSRILPGRVDSPLAGYLAAVASPPVDYLSIFAKLAQTRLPVSIIDQFGAWVPPGKPRQPCAIFPLGVSTAPGKRVADYLLSLGHRHAVYFSMYHNSPWSQARFEGLRRTFADAGHRDTPRILSLSGDDWIDQSFVDVSADPLLPALSKVPASLDNLEIRRRMSRRLQPMFEQALADSEVTAWIGANDGIAVCALEFLRGKGIEPPTGISLVAFDDSVVAMTHRITSYNFNIAGIVGAAFRHLLQPRLRPEVPRLRTVEIPGTIVERETTGRARV